MMTSAARLPTPVMVAEPVTGHRVRGDHLVDAAIQGGDGAFQVPPGGQGPARSATRGGRRSGPPAPGAAGGASLGSLPLASSARTWGSRSPATRAASMARPETPRTSAATEPLLDASVLQRLLDPLALGAVGLDQPLAVAAKIPQLADRRRGHEAAPQQPTLQQLTQPGGITDVGLAAGQDPGRGGRSSSRAQTRALPAPTRSASSIGRWLPSPPG